MKDAKGNNKLICDFMGIVYYPIDNTFVGPEPWDDNEEPQEFTFQEQDIAFDSNYKWLSAVLDKIEKLPKIHKTSTHFNNRNIFGDGYTVEIWYTVDGGWEVFKGKNKELKLVATYEAVVEFLKYLRSNTVK